MIKKNRFILTTDKKYAYDVLTSTKTSVDFLLEERFIYYKNAYIYREMLEWLIKNHSEILI